MDVGKQNNGFLRTLEMIIWNKVLQLLHAERKEGWRETDTEIQRDIRAGGSNLQEQK